MSHLIETKIPLILYRFRDGCYKTDKEAVDAILEAFREALPTIDLKAGRTASYTVGQDDYRIAVLKMLEGK